MAVRSFNGSSDYIGCSIGALSGWDGGPATIAVWVKPASTKDQGVINGWAFSQNSAEWHVYLGGDGRFYTGLSDSGYAGPYLTGEWFLLVMTKGNGSATPRWHIYRPATTSWTHANSSSTAGDGATNSTTVDIGRAWGDFYGGLIAVAATWKSNVGNDAAIEALGLETSLAGWEAASPDALWPLNQESTATPVEDITGGGADQTSITGTTVVTTDDPPGFSFGGGGEPAQATAAVALSLTATGTASTAHAVTAAVPLGLELAGTADAPEVPPAQVTAAVPLAVDVAATGRATHHVTTSIPLTVTPAGTTDAPPVPDAEATTSIPLGLAVTTTSTAERAVTATVPMALAVTATAAAPEITVPGTVTTQIPLSLSVPSQAGTEHRVSAAVPLNLTLPATTSTDRAVTTTMPLTLQLAATVQAENPLSPGTATPVPPQTPTVATVPAETPAVAAAASRVPSSTAVGALVPTAGGVT